MMPGNNRAFVLSSRPYSLEVKRDADFAKKPLKGKKSKNENLKFKIFPYLCRPKNKGL